MRKHLGFALLAVSFAPWAVYAALPFFNLATGEAALLATGAFVAGQIASGGGVLLLGNKLWERLKQHRARCPCQ